MLTVLNATGPVFGLIALGALFGKTRGIGREGIAALNALTVWLTLPAFLFVSLASGKVAPFHQPGFLIVSCGTALITFAIGLFVILRGRQPFVDRVLASLAASYANSGFIGIPLLGALLGPTGVAAAALSSVFTLSVQFTVGVLLVELGLHRDRGILQALRPTMMRLVTNPLVSAPIAGMVWAGMGWQLPVPLHRLLDLLGAAAPPCALVTIGAFLMLPQNKARVTPLGAALAIKLIGQPLVAAGMIAMLALLGAPMPRDWAIAAILLAALPTGTGPFMLAQLYRREAGLASRTILLSTILGAVTVSLLAAWLLR